MPEYTIADFADPNVANGINRFTYSYEVFVCSPTLCKDFNNLLNTQFRKVFVNKTAHRRILGVFSKQRQGLIDLELDGEDVFFLTKKGHLIKLWISEWGGIKRMV